MAHLLLFDLPGGNDFTVLEDAVRMGHQVTLCSGDVGHYRRQGSYALDCLALCHQILEIPDFEEVSFEQRVLAAHAILPFSGVLCLIDIRLIAASRIAARLDLPFLHPEVAKLLRDKVQVREVLARHGIRQPAFARAGGVAELREAVGRIGYPVVVKPADGYGSQDVTLLETPDELEGLVARLSDPDLGPTDYGFGVRASLQLAVEQYIRGRMIGCDVLVGARQRLMLGVNEKCMMAPPSFAMRGSCFPSTHVDHVAVQDYAFRILDAVGFHVGAAHLEMIVTEDGPYLVEINARLVSAQIPFLLGYAFGASVHEALIAVHLNRPLTAWVGRTPLQYCAIRWLTSDCSGTLQRIEFPAVPDPAVRRVVAFRKPGEAVRPARHNGDRIAYVMAVGATQAQAEATAEAFLADTRLVLN